jgi:hypothetical protein
LNDFLDDSVSDEMKADWHRHVNECPNCFVIVDTTRRTLQVFKGNEVKEIPADVEARLMNALERKMAARKPQA